MMYGQFPVYFHFSLSRDLSNIAYLTLPRDGQDNSAFMFPGQICPALMHDANNQFIIVYYRLSQMVD